MELYNEFMNETDYEIDSSGQLDVAAEPAAKRRRADAAADDGREFRRVSSGVDGKGKRSRQDLDDTPIAAAAARDHSSDSDAEDNDVSREPHCPHDSF